MPQGTFRQRENIVRSELMLRIVGTILISGIVGVGIGKVQSAVLNRGYEERFLGARTSLAEARGEITTAQVQQATGKPSLEVVGSTEFDFGTMLHGETMSHEFTFRNTGDGPLNLDMGTSTCKCTVGDLESSIIQAGDETKVKLTWTAQTVLPEFGQSATIHTNDSAHAEVKLRVRGKIVSSFVSEPAELILGDVPVTERIQRTLHIFTYLEESETLEDFSWTNKKTEEFVAIQFERLELDPDEFPKHKNARHVHRVHLDISPGMPLGPLAARIQYETDQGEKVGLMEIPVVGKITGDITLVGGKSFDPSLNMVSMGNVKSDVGASVSIWLAAQGANVDQVVPAIESVVPGESLQVSIGEPRMRGKRKMFPIRFEVPKGAPAVYYPGNSRSSFGKVVVKTNLESAPLLPIHVRLIVEE